MIKSSQYFFTFELLASFKVINYETKVISRIS